MFRRATIGHYAGEGLYIPDLSRPVSINTLVEICRDINGMRRALRWILVVYVGLCAVALLLIWASAKGAFGLEPDPVAAVFAVLLAQPWLGMLGTEAGGGGLVSGILLIVACMALNAGILWLVQRLLPGGCL